jgi:alkanesulfonate monooxygenase SsuD/methylene tetrahydromethanopterin reductase-like flavin-dependent oxidoreductase (luciferase family)
MDAYWTPQEKFQVSHMLTYSIVGSPETVRAGLQRFIALTNADELMVTAPIFDHQARRRSYEILADIAGSMETPQAAKIGQKLEQK